LYILSKILWFIVQPSSLIVVAIVVGALLGGTQWRRSGRALLLAGVAGLLIVGLSPLSDLLIWPLEERFPRPELGQAARVDGIIILGGAEDSRANPRRELAGLNEAAERYTEAVWLARRFPQARVVFSGGSGALFTTEGPEAVSAARLLEGLGIAKERTVLEDKSRTTHENALYTKRLIEPKPGERWLLVTSAWHMPRAVGCFRQVGFAVEAWPVDYRTSGRVELRLHGSVHDGLRRTDFAVREHIGLVAYWLMGRSSALYPAP
jgi:uncharacterized SAM-binding protein YcdF (DUF218 family)